MSFFKVWTTLNTNFKQNWQRYIVCLNNRLSKKCYHVETISIGLQYYSTAFLISYQFEMFFCIDLIYGVWTNAPEENCPSVRVRVWFRVSVRIKIRGEAIFLGGNCPRTLNYISIIFWRNHFQQKQIKIK